MASLRVHHPSLICICGDVVVGHRPEEDRSPLTTQTNVLPFLSGCAAIAPTYLSLGNHEWMVDQADLETIRTTGVVILDNSCIELDGLVIGGLTSGYVMEYRRFRATQDGSLRYPKNDNLAGIRWAAARHEPDVDWLNGYSSVPGYHILLCHHPEYWPLISGKKIEIVLSGHAHGGHWRIFGRGLISPGQGLLPKFTKGIYDEHLVVSSGLGNTTKLPRLFNPVEVVYVESP